MNIVYYSASGNTEKMANLIAEGIAKAGKSAEVINVSNVNANIFDDEEEFLYGLVIFDNIRMANKASAQVHIVNDKSIFGKKVRDIYKHIIETCGFDILYAEIPSIAVHAIGMCKRLGFKKTGYIPEALPYVNSKGIEQMYDIQIWSLIKK